MAKHQKTTTVSDSVPFDLSGVMLELYLLQRFGPRLTMHQLVDLLQIGYSTAVRQIRTKEFPISTYMEAGNRYADFRDVAKHLTRCREEAQERAEQE